MTIEEFREAVTVLYGMAVRRELSDPGFIDSVVILAEKLGKPDA